MEAETKIRERFKWQKDKYDLVVQAGNGKAQQRLWAYMDALNFSLKASGLKPEPMPGDIQPDRNPKNIPY